jgi:hypothetical protein
MMIERKETTNNPLNNCNGEPIIDPLEKASIFLEKFSPLSNASTALNPEQEEKIDKSLQNSEGYHLDTEFSLQEMSRSILHLPDKAMGLDRIHNRMLKNLNENNRESPRYTQLHVQARIRIERLEMRHSHANSKTQKHPSSSRVILTDFVNLLLGENI